MIDTFPNELIFEIFSYLEKFKDLQSCLFVCSQWAQLISHVVQINHHKHKLLRWWNIHQQVVKHQPLKIKITSSAPIFFTTSKHFLERGYSLDIIKLETKFVVNCRTIFDHVCKLFSIPLQNYNIKNLHVGHNDDCCVHFRNGNGLIIRLRENKLPSFVIRRERNDSKICDFFNEMQGIEKNYHNSPQHVFYLSNENLNLFNRSIHLTIYDTNENKIAKTMKLSQSDCFIPKNLFSKNHLYFPTEHYLVQFESNIDNFQVYSIQNEPKNTTFFHFHFTQKYGLLFWFDKKCYVGKIDGTFTKLFPFPRLNINFITQFYNVIHCEKNDELFVIYITSFTSSPKISLLS